jgi:clathrin heavy chain
VAAKNPNTDGMICINKAGQVISLNIDEQNFIPFIINLCRHIPDNVGMAFKLAQRFHLPGADELFVTQFNKLLMQSDYAGAARVARDAPGTLLRNQETINKFKTLQS